MAIQLALIIINYMIDNAIVAEKNMTSYVYLIPYQSLIPSEICSLTPSILLEL